MDLHTLRGNDKRIKPWAERKPGMNKQPLSPAFNAAVMTMARKVCPCGYDIAVDCFAPSTLEHLNLRIKLTGRIMVNNDHSENTIFGDAEHNFAYRAWHDWTHWIIQAPFTLEGEVKVAHRQMEDIRRVYGYGKQTALFCLLIEEEVIGQAEEYAATGSFPEDQLTFAKEYIALAQSRMMSPHLLRHSADI